MKAITEIIKKNKTFSAFLLLCLLSQVVLFPSNPARATTIVLILGIFLFHLLRYNDKIVSSVLLFLLALSFNITLQLDFLPDLYNAYSANISVNYLIPTLSILDLAAMAIVLLNWPEDWGKNKKYLYLIWGYGLVHLGTHLSLNVGVNVARLALYATLFVIAVSPVDWKGVSIKRWKELRYVVLALLLLQLFIALGQALGGQSIGVPFLGEPIIAAGVVGSSSIDYGPNLLLRGYGTFPHPNVLAGYTLFLYALSSLRWDRDSGKKVGLFTTVLLLVVASLLYLTMSRGALVVFFGALLLPSLLNFAGRFLVALPPVLTGLMGRGDSITERAALYTLFISSMWKIPLLGYGAGESTRAVIEGSLVKDGGILLTQPVHNIYMVMIMEHGWVFGSLAIIMIAYVPIRALLVASRSKESTNYTLAVFLLVLLIIGNIDHYLFTLPQGLGMLFVVIGVITLRGNGVNGKTRKISAGSNNVRS